jgi:hypothetical protein
MRPGCAKQAPKRRDKEKSRKGSANNADPIRNKAVIARSIQPPRPAKSTSNPCPRQPEDGHADQKGAPKSRAPNPAP